MRKRLERRDFLKKTGLFGISLPLIATGAGLGFGLRPKRSRASETNKDDRPASGPLFNGEGYCVQATVEMDHYLSDGTIRAFVDGGWQTYTVRHLSQGFIDWNIGTRLERLEDPMNSMRILSGPHNGAVATYGSGRGDSRFSLNNAFKGFGPIPKDEIIGEWIERLANEWGASMTAKLQTLLDLYGDTNHFDFRNLASLELYSSPRFQTHSFLNQMENPIATVVFLDSPEGSFELRTIPRLLHPDDPDLPSFEYNKLAWVNAIHDFFHGGPNPAETGPYRIGAIYYVIEEFDNSPSDGKRGVRTVPRL